MGKLQKNQNGFGAVGIVLVILVIVVVAALGVVLYKHDHKTGIKSDTATTSSTSTQQPATNTTQPAQTAQQYLVINEWAVEAPYSGNDTFTYTMSGNNAASIGTKQLASADSACINRGAGTILRFLPTDYADTTNTTTVAQAAQQNPSAYVYINGYYYQFMHTQSVCGDATKTSNLSTQANAQLKEAFSKLKATN